jgi:hypothetical protein
LTNVLRSPFLYLAGGLALTGLYVYAILDWNRSNLYRKGSLETVLQLAAAGSALFLLVALIAGGAAAVRRGRPLHGAFAALLGLGLIAGLVWAFLFSMTLG